MLTGSGRMDSWTCCVSEQTLIYQQRSLTPSISQYDVHYKLRPSRRASTPSVQMNYGTELLW